MIPGLTSPIIQGGAVSLVYSSSALNVDPWVELGSPAVAVNANIYVGAGAVIGAADCTAPAMLLRFWDRSVINLFIAGTVGAAGGKGANGDRGRDNGSGSSFVGGGGGGGAGTNPGAKGNSADLVYEADDGAAGTTTTGGAGGQSNFGSYSGGSIPNSSTLGSRINQTARNPAIMVWPTFGHYLTVNIWLSGSLSAGGDGGRGGYQDAHLPGGAHDGENGEDLPAYYDPASGGLTDHPVIWQFPTFVTVNIKAGGSYPSIRGRVVTYASLPI